jgi:indolepyruvate ferredoxin oxidoreductase beta subunit
MSQRGGSVASDVRFGGRVLSPMITEGEADFLVVLSEDQVELNTPVLRPGGVLLGPDLLPQDVVANRRVWNVALLGALSAHLSVEVSVWEDAIRRALPEKVHETNLRVFHQMREKAVTA